MTNRLPLAFRDRNPGPVCGLAQVSTVTLQGIVKDQTGASLPGVTVTVVHTGTRTSRSLVTDADGRYVAAQLPIGGCEVRGELQGFRTEVRRGITLTVSLQAVVDLVLSVGNLQEVVEVSGEAPRVQTTSSAVSELVDSKTVVFVAQAAIQRVLEVAESIVSREGAMASALRGGTPSSHVMAASYEQMLDK